MKKDQQTKQQGVQKMRKRGHLTMLVNIETLIAQGLKTKNSNSDKKLIIDNGSPKMKTVRIKPDNYQQIEEISLKYTQSENLI